MKYGDVPQRTKFLIVNEVLPSAMSLDMIYRQNKIVLLPASVPEVFKFVTLFKIAFLIKINITFLL